MTVAAGAFLNFYNFAAVLDKKILVDGDPIYAQNNAASTNNTISGPIAITDNRGILNAGGVRSDVATAVPGASMTITGVISNAVGGTNAATITKLGPGLLRSPTPQILLAE